MADKELFVQGNEACALGALAAGCTFFAGYPITPSTEIAESASPKCDFKSPSATFTSTAESSGLSARTFILFIINL